jgi:Flp pilus assembly protein TadB
LIALGYALLKPEIGIIELQLITAGTLLALLPGAYQQGPFAVLAIAGEHRPAGLAYVYSFLFLGLTSLLLLVWPKVEIFMIGLIGGAFVRLWYLQARSRHAIDAEPAAAEGT